MDPYAPPTARIEDIEGRARIRSNTRRLFAIATVVQAILVALGAKQYAAQINAGEVSALLGLLAIVSCVLLYAGTVRFWRDGSRGGLLFLSATLGLAASFYGWGHFYGGPYPLLMGAIVAAFGYFVVFRNRRDAAAVRIAGGQGQ